MILNRRWIALLVAGGLFGEWKTWGQDLPTGGESSSSGSSSGSGASSSFGSGSSSGSGTGGTTSTPTTSPFDSGTPSSSGTPFGSPFDTGGTPSTSTAAPSFFGSGPNGTAPPASGTPAAASTFGTGTAGGPTLPRESAPSFTLPGAYGQASQNFTVGEGRLARPRFRYSASVMTGYDDNTLQTATNTFDVPEVSQEVVVEPAQPAGFVRVPNIVLEQVAIPGTNLFFNQFVQRGTKLEFQKGKDAKTEKVVLQPRIPAQKRVGSFVARASGSYEITFASRKTVFTMDLRGNADYYFSRPSDQTDVNGSLAVNYLHRITPRLQFSASASLGYLSQPDVRLLNGPQRNVGDYFNATSKFDLSYRWTKRFSTVTSFSLNSILYMQQAASNGNYYEGVLGTEARYAWSPRLTLIGEVRYGQTSYEQNDQLNSGTAYLLVGGELTLSRRISLSLRVGESIRQFSNAEDGGVAQTPYLESTVSWRYNPTGFLSWNTRFGFEEAGDINSEVLSLRTGLSAVQAFSARLRGSAGFTYISRTTSNKLTETDLSEQTFDLNLGLEYALSKRFSLNASYTLTNVLSDIQSNEYYRNRIFFGAEYSF